MPIIFLTTEDERSVIRHIDLTNEADFLGLDYIMEQAETRGKRRLH